MVYVYVPAFWDAFHKSWYSNRGFSLETKELKLHKFGVFLANYYKKPPIWFKIGCFSFQNCILMGRKLGKKLVKRKSNFRGPAGTSTYDFVRVPSPSMGAGNRNLTKQLIIHSETEWVYLLAFCLLTILICSGTTTRLYATLRMDMKLYSTLRIDLELYRTLEWMWFITCLCNARQHLGHIFCTHTCTLLQTETRAHISTMPKYLRLVHFQSGIKFSGSGCLIVWQSTCY